MIARIWHGWTTAAQADAYQSLFRTEVLTGMIAQAEGKLLSIELLRRPAGDEVEFISILKFETLADVKNFARDEDDFSEAIIWAKARAMLTRYDTHTEHYDVVETRTS